MLCSVHQVLSACHLVCYKLQEAHSKDEGGMERRSVKKGISSTALYSVSPTCRARGNHFSVLQPPDFLPNVLSSSLVCLCLSHSVSLSHSHFSPSPTPLLSFPLCLSTLLSLPISPLCISFFSSPVQLCGRSCFIAVATRDPFKTCVCTHKQLTHRLFSCSRKALADFHTLQHHHKPEEC